MISISSKTANSDNSVSSKELNLSYIGYRFVNAIYIGSKMAWEAISSCFGAGYWINTYPWKNTDCWKD